MNQRIADPFFSCHRRDLFLLAGVTAAGFVHNVCREQPSELPILPALNRFPRMMQEFFVQQVRAAENAGIQARAALKPERTPNDMLRKYGGKSPYPSTPSPRKHRSIPE